MKSEKIAQMLRDFASFLDAQPEMDWESCVSLRVHQGQLDDANPYFYIPFYDKEKFIAAVKILGNSTKHYTDGEYSKLEVTAKDFPIKLSIPSDKVCRKIVTYDCEALFSDEEVESL